MHAVRWLLQALLGALLPAGLACAQQPQAVQVWLNPGFFSHHFRNGDHRQDNYGAGAELAVAPEHVFLAGSFINSDRERSRYAGYYWRPWQRQVGGAGVSAGPVVVLIDGYSNTHHGRAFPAAFPSLSAQYGIIGANLIFIPASSNGSVLALQFKLRVW